MGIPTDIRGRVHTNSEPASRAESVDLSSTDWTPSVSFGVVTRALKIGTAGNIKVDMLDHGTGVTIPVADNELLPVAVIKVYRTGTTATSIVALA